jgi:hypothetical protein
VNSGRGPVTIHVELIQGTRNATVAVDRVSSKRWAFWDFRLVRHSTYTVIVSSLLERFDAGPAVIRATAVRAPAWLRQPPPVVQEASMQVQAGPQGRR